MQMMALDTAHRLSEVCYCFFWSFLDVPALSSRSNFISVLTFLFFFLSLCFTPSPRQNWIPPAWRPTFGFSSSSSVCFAPPWPAMAALGFFLAENFGLYRENRHSYLKAVNDNVRATAPFNKTASFAYQYIIFLFLKMCSYKYKRRHQTRNFQRHPLLMFVGWKWKRSKMWKGNEGILKDDEWVGSTMEIFPENFIFFVLRTSPPQMRRQPWNNPFPTKVFS